MSEISDRYKLRTSLKKVLYPVIVVILGIGWGVCYLGRDFFIFLRDISSLYVAIFVFVVPILGIIYFFL